MLRNIQLSSIAPLLRTYVIYQNYLMPICKIFEKYFKETFSLTTWNRREQQSSLDITSGHSKINWRVTLTERYSGNDSYINLARKSNLMYLYLNLLIGVVLYNWENGSSFKKEFRFFHRESICSLIKWGNCGRSAYWEMSRTTCIILTYIAP